MAFLESLANRQPGTPRQPEVPGAPPTASRPADKVNPPAAAAGPVGRPPLPPPPLPGGAGRNLPVSQAAAPTARPPAPRPTAEPKARPAPIEPVGLPFGDQLVHVVDHVPNLAEIAEVPEGVDIQTPYGNVDRTGKLTLSPEGEVKYKEAMVNRRKAFGPHPFAGDANAPPAPARLGGRMFNPFTGSWVD